MRGRGTRADDATRAPASEAVPKFTPPVVRERPEPSYPPAALAAGLSATVVLELDVDEKGAVGRAVVKQSAGHGFDEAALAAVQAVRVHAGAARSHAGAVARHLRLQFVPASAAAPARPGKLRGGAFLKGTRAPLADGYGHRRHGATAGARHRRRRRPLRARRWRPARWHLVVNGPKARRFDDDETLGGERDADRHLLGRAGAIRALRVDGARRSQPRGDQPPDAHHRGAGQDARHHGRRAARHREPARRGARAVQLGPASSCAAASPPTRASSSPAPRCRSSITSAASPRSSRRSSSITSTIFPGNFGVRYGRAIAGAIDVDLREPQARSHRTARSRPTCSTPAASSRAPSARAASPWPRGAATSTRHRRRSISPDYNSRRHRSITTIREYSTIRSAAGSFRALVSGSDDQLDLVVRPAAGRRSGHQRLRHAHLVSQAAGALDAHRRTLVLLPAELDGPAGAERQPRAHAQLRHLRRRLRLARRGPLDADAAAALSIRRRFAIWQRRYRGRYPAAAAGRADSRRRCRRRRRCTSTRS